MMDEVMENITKQIVAEKDKFLFETFKRHGYNRNRVMSLAKAGRVKMAQHDNRETYFIDNKPIFTIGKYMKQHEEDNKITYTFREEVLGNGIS